MDFVLVFPLMLAFLPTGQSSPEVTEQKCYKQCPPGYFKFDECNDPDANLRCQICGVGTFTPIANSVTKCSRCNTCTQLKVEIKPCFFDSDVLCDCKEGYYKSPTDSSKCLQCNCKQCEALDNHPDYKRKCKPCERCSGKTTANPFPPSANASTAAATTSASTSDTRSTTSKNTSTPVLNNSNAMPWLLMVVLVLAAIMVFLWLLLLFTWNSFTYPDSCFCWSTNKDLGPHVEDPKFNEQSSHQGSSSNTMTFNICEETPMMTLSQSPAMPEHPAHNSPLEVPHKATRQDEQSDRWPAIVLYAIIKEVPLRRWKEFLRLLSVTDQQLERVELEAGLGQGSIERQYQMLRLWSQRSSVSLDDVFSALHYMDLYGCAQLLQESLEKLQGGLS